MLIKFILAEKWSFILGFFVYRMEERRLDGLVFKEGVINLDVFRYRGGLC